MSLLLESIHLTSRATRQERELTFHFNTLEIVLIVYYLKIYLWGKVPFSQMARKNF